MPSGRHTYRQMGLLTNGGTYMMGLDGLDGLVGWPGYRACTLICPMSRPTRSNRQDEYKQTGRGHTWKGDHYGLMGLGLAWLVGLAIGSVGALARS